MPFAAWIAPVRGTCRALIVCAALDGCARPPPVTTPAEQVRMMGDLRAGRLVLACGARCRESWTAQAGAVDALYRAQRWSDLTIGIMRIGYGGDLAYFYLGEAAHGMGYEQAAITYYTQAGALADGSDAQLRCEGPGGSEAGCRGIGIAAAVPDRIALSREALEAEAAEAAPPVRPHHGRVRTARNARAAGGAKAGLPEQVAGRAQAIDTATLQVHGRTIPLAGVVGRPDAYAAQLQAMIDAQGATVRCLHAGAGYACTLPNGADVARAALSSGIASAAADAPEAYRAQEQAARAAHRGLWKPAAG